MDKVALDKFRESMGDEAEELADDELAQILESMYVLAGAMVSAFDEFTDKTRNFDTSPFTISPEQILIVQNRFPRLKAHDLSELPENLELTRQDWEESNP